MPTHRVADQACSPRPKQWAVPSVCASTVDSMATHNSYVCSSDVVSNCQRLQTMATPPPDREPGIFRGRGRAAAESRRLYRSRSRDGHLPGAGVDSGLLPSTAKVVTSMLEVFVCILRGQTTCVPCVWSELVLGFAELCRGWCVRRGSEVHPTCPDAPRLGQIG